MPPPLPFSSFRRSQLIFEMRYDEAYLLWDRTGSIWTALQPLFKKLRSNQAQPNQQTFIADDRYVLTIGLQRTSLTDHNPAGNVEKLLETVATFANTAIETLELRALERVGARCIFSLPCKSIEEAREKACAALPAFSSRPPLFNIKSGTIGPTIKLECDDGDFGYIAQLYANEKRFEVNSPPEATDSGWEKFEKKLAEVLLDLDFHTKKPVRVNAFDCKLWLQGWNKAIARDADGFLDYLAGKRGG